MTNGVKQSTVGENDRIREKVLPLSRKKYVFSLNDKK
jgi:hypothetical protein